MLIKIPVNILYKGEVTNDNKTHTVFIMQKDNRFIIGFFENVIAKRMVYPIEKIKMACLVFLLASKI